MANARTLMIATAMLELATASALLIAPSFVAELLLGVGLDSPAARIVGRVAGAALLAISLNCWVQRNRGNGLLVGLLVYNVFVSALLIYSNTTEHLHGIALWLACGLHSILAIGCVVSLRSGDRME